MSGAYSSGSGAPAGGTYRSEGTRMPPSRISLNARASVSLIREFSTDSAKHEDSPSRIAGYPRWCRADVLQRFRARRLEHIPIAWNRCP